MSLSIHFANKYSKPSISNSCKSLNIGDLDLRKQRALHHNTAGAEIMSDNDSRRRVKQENVTGIDVSGYEMLLDKL